MSSTVSRPVSSVRPPDHPARVQALDAARSVLVQAPAGSGKTDLLTRRFLRLLGEVDEPGQIVAITFTKAAAAEMRHRILSELENAAEGRAAEERSELDDFSTETLAARALQRSRALKWNLTELPAQLRITTIDAFCRELALQQPLLSQLGGGIAIHAQPGELYRRAARRTLEQIDAAEPELRTSIETLLLWRDNGWQEMEGLLVTMLAQRDRWMQDFVLDRVPDWEALRERLERPFARAVREKILELSALLDQVPRARAEALELARFSCEQTAGAFSRELAELSEFPAGPFEDAEQLEEAREACCCLAGFLQTQKGQWRSEKGLNATAGFPATVPGRAAKKRFAALVVDLRAVPGIETALAAVGDLPPARYTDDNWLIVRACFALLRRAAAELRVVFAEQGAVDYIEVAQIALNVLRGEEGSPADVAMDVADGIRHLLVDEFQDTSRRQHELLVRLISAWPEREGRTCFVVGDPMQSIYFFRDADAELFPRVRDNGLEVLGDEPFAFDSVGLTANFRTAAGLVGQLNTVFESVFAEDDGSGVTFAASVAARNGEEQSGPRLVGSEEPLLKLHVDFVPQNPSGSGATEARQRIADQREAAQAAQVQEMVALIRSHWPRLTAARAEGKKYRIAVLGRARKALAPVAAALREADIPFAAVDLEKLNERPEVLDALALARALLNPHDRVAWLGVLRAPWCGLSIADLHTLVSADDPELLVRPVPELLLERGKLISVEGQAAAERVMRAMDAAARLRSAQPTMAVGTWLEQAWLRLGGAACVGRAARANLDLLWKCLDDLPEGEQGILGAALDAALDGLTALPDPEADNQCGVQLMTIHKAKGLEFEVVIVPELQAGAGRGHGELLAWMERGLSAAEESGEVTEFLVAPIQPKGAGRGKAKAWVERIRREREAQELRRLLYVAMTRAREELHLFARPAYKTAAEGSFELAVPRDCLLATAWPALQEQVRQQFEAWKASATPGMVEGIAAAEDNLFGMPQAAKSNLIWRLPADYKAAQAVRDDEDRVLIGSSAAADQLYRRHEGGLLSRALGIATHALLQELARLRLTLGWEEARSALAKLGPRIASQVRAAGIERGHAQRIAAQAIEIAWRATRDPAGQWILSPHAEAASEARWAGVVGDAVHSVQVDRVFRAGAEPLSEGNEAWWIVDYKTAHSEGVDAQKALPALRELFAPQLEAYARVLRGLHGPDARVCAGLYYPRMGQFDGWEI